MKKFLSLLNPEDRITLVNKEGKLVTNAELLMQRNDILFRRYVNESQFNLWRPGDFVSQCPTRFLIGLQYHYSPNDLYFADILNTSLAETPDPNLVIDVCGLPWIRNEQALENYFPGVQWKHLGWRTNPIIGIWENGKLKRHLIGGVAMDYVLHQLDCNITSDEIWSSVRPPAPEMLE